VILALEADGAQCLPGVARDALAELESAIDAVPRDRPGTRLHDVKPLHRWLASEGPIGSVAAHALGPICRPVRAIPFDKSPTANWSLGWHQDRAICVRERIEAPGFGPWTVKAGLLHVAPPFPLLARMVTLRVHLDDVPADNAPLLIAPGSHRALVAEAEIEAVVARCGSVACLADAGDVWIYATPILHASAASRIVGRRRVLQVDYSADILPAGLEWAGI